MPLAHDNTKSSTFSEEKISTKNEMFDVLLESGSKEDIEKAVDLACAAGNANGRMLARCSRLYIEGKHIDKNVCKAIKLIEDAVKLDVYWRNQLVETLLASSIEDNDKRAFELCQKWYEEDNKIRETLIRLYWHGVGVERDRQVAKRLMRESDLFRRKYFLQSVRDFTKDIFSIENIVIWNTVKHGNSIICSCLQNNLDVKYVVNESEAFEDYLVPPFFDSISAKEVDDLKDCAVIIEYSDYMSEKERDGFPKNAIVFTYSLDGCVCEGTNSLFIKNPNFQDVYVVSDTNEQGLISRLEKENIRIKGTLTYSELKKTCPVQGKSKLKILISGEDLRKFKPLAANFAASDTFIDLENEISMKSKVLFRRGLEVISLLDACIKYITGKKIYESLKTSHDEIYLFISDGAIGSHHRILCKTKQYSKHYNVNAKIILPEWAKDLLVLFQYDGIILSNKDRHALKTYMVLFNEKNEKIFFLNQYFGTGSFLLSVPSGLSTEYFDQPSRLFRIPQSRYDPIIYPNVVINMPPDQFNNSVLINPYGTWIRGHHPDKLQAYHLLFEKIAQKLRSEGVTVYTNSINAAQQALPETEVFRHTISDLVSVCRQFKHIVTIFSGFMEALILTECNLTVVTPVETESRKQMAEVNARDNYWEYCLDLNNVEGLAKNIVDNILQTDSVSCDISQGMMSCESVKMFDSKEMMLQIGLENPIYSNAIAETLLSGKDAGVIEYLEGVKGINIFGKYLLAYANIKGIFTEKDLERAWSMLKEQKTDGHSEFVKYALAVELLERGRDDDNRLAFELLTELTVLGSTTSAAKLATMYRDGKHVEKDLNTAIKILRDVVGKNAKWSIELFDMLWKRGSEEDLKEAFEMISVMSLEAGSIIGRLARAYRDGKGVGKNIDKAIELMRVAATKNVRWAKNELIDMLMKRGGDGDIREAFTVCSALVAREDADAMGRLSRMYYQGEGVGKDVEKAIEWMRKAAEGKVTWKKELEKMLADCSLSDLTKT